MYYFEELIDEYRLNPSNSRLKQYVPTVGSFHTRLPLSQAFQMYDRKYSISKRCYVAPSVNEIRHILNLSQVIAVGETLKFISFDGDQTLYADGENFEQNEELSSAIITLLENGVKVVVITAAGYGLDGSKYEVRLRGLLNMFISYPLSKEKMECFYVVGGECNYLLQCTEVHQSDAMTSEDSTRKAILTPVPYEIWQAEHLQGPKPFSWAASEINRLLDIAEISMTDTINELNLRAKVFRKERAVGVYPGGVEMCEQFPIGHGSKKLKREALDELVLRVLEATRIQNPPISIPFCVFNGGRDAWLDIGNKAVAVSALQAYFQLRPEACLHVGDQFLNTGNDFAVRESSPCVWIINPHETGKVLQLLLRFMKLTPSSAVKMKRSKSMNFLREEFRQLSTENLSTPEKIDVYSGEKIK